MVRREDSSSRSGVSGVTDQDIAELEATPAEQKRWYENPVLLIGGLIAFALFLLTANRLFLSASDEEVKPLVRKEEEVREPVNRPLEEFKRRMQQMAPSPPEVSTTVQEIFTPQPEPTSTERGLAEERLRQWYTSGAVRLSFKSGQDGIAHRSEDVPSGYHSAEFGAPPPGSIGVGSASRVAQLSPYEVPNESTITETVRPNTLWNNDNRIIEGKVIRAKMVMPMVTTLPGIVIAKVSENVYAESGDRILIPKGAKVIGTAETSGIRRTQDRIGIIWHRVVYRVPGNNDGIVEVAIDSNAYDAMGRAGVPGERNVYFWERFGEAVMISLIGAGASNIGDTAQNSDAPAGRYREAFTESFANTAQRSIDEKQDFETTINTSRAIPITIIVAKDFIFGEGQAEGLR